MKSLFVILLVSFILIISCTNNENIQTDDVAIIKRYLNIPSIPYNYAQPELPAFFNDQFVTIQNNTPANNKITDWEQL